MNHFTSSSVHTKDEAYALAIRLLAKGVREGCDKPNSKSTQDKLSIAKDLLKKISETKTSLSGTSFSLKSPYNVYYVRPGRTTIGDLNLQYAVHKFFKAKTKASPEFTSDNNPLAVDNIGIIAFKQPNVRQTKLREYDRTVDFTQEITIEAFRKTKKAT